MIAMLFSLVIAVLVVILSFLFPLGDMLQPFSHLFAAVGIFFLVIMALINAMAWIPVQKAESKTTPRIAEVYRKDFFLRLDNIGFIAFAIVSFFCVLLANSLPANYLPYLFAFWIVCLGVALDLLRHFFIRVMHFLDPFYLIKQFTSYANREIASGNIAEAYVWVDSLAEIGTKGVVASSTSLATKSVDEIQEITNRFLRSVKNIAHSNNEGSPDKLEGRDAIQYHLFYVFQRLEMMNDKAISAHVEPLCHHMVTVLGKIALYAASCDMTLVDAPLRCLGYCAKRAQNTGIPEVGVKATYVLVEVAKGIIQDNDITYAELLVPFKTLVMQLEEIAKETFRQDKQMSVLLLMHPFQQLKELFQSPKCGSHRDTPAILTEIDRVLGEFQALDTIMQGISNPVS
jgi:hypothetical protein